MMHLSLDDAYIAVSSGEHDCAFDHADDVPSHLTSVLITRKSATRCSLVQVNLKLRGHLVETLSQPFAKLGSCVSTRKPASSKAVTAGGPAKPVASVTSAVG